MSTGSLTVKISADVNNFTKNLGQMTGAVDKAAKSIMGIGKNLTLGLTLPIGLALGMLAKMGLENQQISRRMAREFGDMTESMQHSLDTIMKAVPETGTELQKMATDLHQVGEDLGYSSANASKFAEGAMLIAANISSAKLIPYAEALEGTEKALKGTTKGLRNMGVIIDDTMIKNEAYRLGLVRTGAELNPLGKSMAIYSLLLQKTGGMTKETASIQLDAAMKLQFMKRDFAEFADTTSNLVVPALTLLIGVGKTIVGWLNSMPEGLRTTIILVATLAATIGPLIVVMTGLVSTIVKLRAAIGLLMAADGLKGLLLALAAPEVLAGLVALAALLGVAGMAWKKFHKDADDDGAFSLALPPSVQSLMKGNNSPTSTVATLDPVSELTKRAGAITSAYDEGDGNRVLDALKAANTLNEKARTLYAEQKDTLSEMAIAAAQVAKEMQRIVSFDRVVRSLFYNGDKKDTMPAVKSYVAMTEPSAKTKFSQKIISDEVALQFRETLIKFGSTLDVAREATLSFKEALRRNSEDFKLTIAQWKQQFSSASNIGASAMGGLKDAVGGVVSKLSIWTLIIKVIGEILGEIGPQISAIFSLFKVMGKQLGYVLAPVFKLLYNVIKWVIIAFTWLSRIIVQFTATLLTGVGQLLKWIGNAINKLSPGNPGNGLKKTGEALIEYGRSQYALAGKLKQSTKELQDTSWDEALAAVNGLGDAARSATEELLNVSDAFKYRLRHFQASDAMVMDAEAFTTSSPAAANFGTVSVVVDGRALANVVVKQTAAESQRQFGTPFQQNKLTSLY